MTMTDDELSAGDTVDLTVEAEVVATYQSGRVKLRWHSGEEIVYTSDSRLNND